MTGTSASGLLLLLLGVLGLSLFVQGTLDRTLAALFSPAPVAGTAGPIAPTASTALPRPGERRAGGIA